MKKHLVYSILIGIGIALIFTVLSYYVYSVEINKVEYEKKRVSDLVNESISSQSRNMKVFADTIGAFYKGSETVTNEEFKIFVTHTLSQVHEIQNIAVWHNGKIIQSHPIIDFELEKLEHVEHIINLNGYEMILIKHEESQDSISYDGLVVLLLVDPEHFIPLENILQDRYKVEITMYNSTWFLQEGYPNNEYFSNQEMDNLVVVERDIETPNHVHDIPHTITYQIWKEDFKINYIIPLVIFTSGLVVSYLVSFLFYTIFKSQNIIRKQNEKMNTLNRTLKQDEEFLKKTQSLVLESDEKHRNLFELSPLGMVVLDLEYTITSCNSKAIEMFGYDRNYMIGKHFTYFVSPKDVEKFIALFRQVLIEGTIYEQTIVGKRKDGEEFTLIINAGVMKDKNAQNSGIICILS